MVRIKLGNINNTNFNSKGLIKNSHWIDSKGYSNIYNLLDPKLGGRYLVSSPEFLVDFTICYSREGWLLMSKGQEPMLFYNPFRNNLIVAEQGWNPCVSFCFSHLPTSLDCVIVGMMKLLQSTILRGGTMGGLHRCITTIPISIRIITILFTWLEPFIFSVKMGT